MLLVLGMHRSGTSAVTKSLSLMGFRPPREIMPANQNNRSGFWESYKVAVFNEQVLNDVDAAWYTTALMPLESLNDDQRAPYIKQAEALLRGQFSELDNAVLKDPRICRLTPIWFEAAKHAGAECKCLLVCRNPIEVALSLQARNEFTLEHSIQLWTSYMLEAELNSRATDRAIVSYDALLQQKDVELRAKVMGLGFSQNHTENAGKTEVDAFLSSSQRHHNARTREDQRYREQFPLTFELYDLLCESTGLTELQRLDEIRIAWRGANPKLIPDLRADQVPRLPFEVLQDANKLISGGDKRKALTVLETAEQNFPDSFQLHFRRSQLCGELEQWEQAELAIRKAIAINARRPDHFAQLSEVLTKLERYDEAIGASREAIGLDRNWAPFRHQLGKLYSRQGRTSDAVAEFTIATELDQENPLYQRALAEIIENPAKNSGRGPNGLD